MDDHLAAVKIPTDPSYVAAICRCEVSVSIDLSHPNLVRVIGFDPTGTPPYLISELVDGPSLRELLAKGRLPLDQAIAIMRQVAYRPGLRAGQGVVHGDMKPGNVLIQKAAEAGGYSAEVQ